MKFPKCKNRSFIKFALELRTGDIFMQVDKKPMMKIADISNHKFDDLAVLYVYICIVDEGDRVKLV